LVFLDGKRRGNYMEALGHLISGFEIALTLANLLYCAIGITVGMLIGVLPGIGPTTGTAILIPLTIGMDPIPSIIMLSGIYYGAMYGGTVTSVLINTPGEASSVITCLDGYPMAQQGRGGAALGIAAIGSFIGGSVSVIGLICIGPPLARMALKFGPPEFFALILLGMTLVIGLLGKSVLRGAISALIGLCLAMIGVDTSSGIPRFVFGTMYLMDGIQTVTMAIGLFGITEIITSVESETTQVAPSELKGLFPRKEEWWPSLKAIIRGTGLGFGTGLLPGTNSVIPTILSYAVERKLAKDPSRFGKGAIEGVAGPETANNAYCSGALVPLFTLGIPSSPAIAILLGAFIMHGLRPGPQLFQNNPDFVWSIIASMFIGNVMLLIMNLPMAGLWAKIAMIPTKLLFPMIIAIAALGSFSLNNSLFDVGIMLLFGIVGYLFRKVDIPLAPIILTFMLGPAMETALVQSLTMFRGNLFQFFQRPISGTLLTIAIVVIASSIYAGIKKKKGMLSSDVEI
jgi:putative tricarboxylic transport membrane protein